MNSALIIIDLQNDFVYNTESPVYIKNAMKIVDNIKKIRKKFNGLIINILTKHLKDKSNWGIKDIELNRYYCIENTKGMELIDDLKFKLDNEIHLYKHTYNGFYNTNLLNILLEKNIRKLYFTGLTTGCCVSSTARYAYDYGFKLYFIKECLISSDISEHKKELNFFNKSLGKVISINNIIENL